MKIAIIYKKIKEKRKKSIVNKMRKKKLRLKNQYKIKNKKNNHNRKDIISKQIFLIC